MEVATQPCLSPLVTGNASEEFPLSSTRASMSSWKWRTILLNLSGQPKLPRFSTLPSSWQCQGLCQVYKRYVEISILFLTLFLKLPCSKRHHVGSFTALPEAIRTLWEVAIGWRGFLQGSFQRWLSEESLRDCRTIACFTFTYIGGQWLQRWWTRAYLGRWWNIPPNSPGWRYSHYVALFPLVVMFQRTEAHKCSSRHYRSV